MPRCRNCGVAITQSGGPGRPRIYCVDCRPRAAQSIPRICASRICACGQPAIFRSRYGRCIDCSAARKKDRERCRPPRDRSHRRQQKTCESCGGSFIGWPRARRCAECRNFAKPRVCTVPWALCAACMGHFIARHGSKACPCCRGTARWRNGNYHRTAVPFHLCTECGTQISARRHKCDRCRSETRSAARRRSKLRRKKRVTISEPYTLRAIAERDGHRCGICSLRVNLKLAVPHPQAATIDHIVPISRGGQDVRVNVQLAHFLCNSLKSDKGHGQLLLVG